MRRLAARARVAYCKTIIPHYSSTVCYSSVVYYRTVVYSITHRLIRSDLAEQRHGSPPTTHATVLYSLTWCSALHRKRHPDAQLAVIGSTERGCQIGSTAANSFIITIIHTKSTPFPSLFLFPLSTTLQTNPRDERHVGQIHVK